MTMDVEISICTSRLSAEDLKSALLRQLDSGTSIQLNVRKPSIQFRGVDSTVLVATVSAMGTALGALIAGVLKLAQGAKSGKIVIQGSQGQRLEIPADTPEAKIDKLMERVKSLDNEALTITLD